jgi:CDP-diacylglycerol---serine O-phosphatidyltransferase
LARQVLLVRVGRRRRSSGGPDTLEAHSSRLDGGSRLIHPADLDPRELGRRDPRLVAPVSPAAPGPLTMAGSTVAGSTAAGASRTIPLLPGPQTRARRLRFVLVQACTLGSLLLGLAAIFLSLHGEPRWAAACLVGCVTFDGLDGALARRFGVASPFGAQMDSLADMCSFGIAAPVVVYASIHSSAPGPLVAGACALVAMCAAIRLARFNVSPKDGRFFCGVPTTMAAAVLGLGTLIGLRLPGLVAVAVVALLALAMVSSFPYAKLARIARVPAWLWLVPVAGAVLDYRLTFAGLVLLYLVSGPFLWFRGRRLAATGRLGDAGGLSASGR